jgi:peptidoglycan/LPS O-acetylase OafA/YrhL
VDVFFVLSGYLITSIILHDLRDGSFSLREFYARRIQRLLPNATLTIFVTVLLWFVILTPSAAISTARHGLATMFSLSNFYLVRYAGGYWGNSAASFPLLHTWSLAVEEQFYLLFPTVLWLIIKRPGRRARRIVGALLVVSFGLGIFLTSAYPTAGFYLLPSRAWELLVGAALATVLVPAEAGGPIPPVAPRRVLEICGWLGFAGILAAFLFMVDQSQLYGAAVLLPTIGALLVLVAVAQQQTGLSRVMSWKPLVMIGAVSYSLYLWHWPLIVFWRTYASMVGWPSYVGVILGVGSGIVLAILAYNLVERPLRGRGPGRRRRLLAIAAGFSTCVVLLALLSGLSPSQLDKNLTTAAVGNLTTATTPHDPAGSSGSAAQTGKTAGQSETPVVFIQPVFDGLLYDAAYSPSDAAKLATSTRYSGVYMPLPPSGSEGLYEKGGIIHLYGGPTPQVVVLGSSHAIMYGNQIDAVCRELGVSVSFLCADGWPAIPAKKMDKKTAAFYDAQQWWMSRWKPDLVMVMDRWDARAQDMTSFASQMDAYLAELELSTPHIALFTQVPVLDLGEEINLGEYVHWYQDRYSRPPEIRPDSAEATRLATVSLFESDAKTHPDLQIIRADQFFYNADETVKYWSGNQFLYADDNHLSEAGASLLRPSIRDTIVSACGLTP